MPPVPRPAQRSRRGSAPPLLRNASPFTFAARSSDLMEASPPTCLYKTSIPAQPNTKMIGWISQHSGFALNGNVAGIFQLMNLTQDATHPTIGSWMSSPQESRLGSPPGNNCAFQANQYNTPQDLVSIPDVDFYGNRTDGGNYVESLHYKKEGVALNPAGVNSPYQIGLAFGNVASEILRLTN
jgi:hypothetical protein